MERKNTRRRGGWAIAMAVLTLGNALAVSQAAFADDDNGKGGKVPIIIRKPIITHDPKPAPQPKKKDR
jgi:hypothetical protein